MKLRQKKTNNLSEEAYGQEFQNQHFQTFNRKSDFSKKPNYDLYANSSAIQASKNNYAQILVRFINNANIAKQGRQKKTQNKPSINNTLFQQNNKSKRIRKTSENTSFDEQKKIQYPKSAFSNTDSLRRKKKSQEQRQKTSYDFSIQKKTQTQTGSLNLRKQLPEQNIINNYSIGNNAINFSDYAGFLQPQFISINPNLLNSWFQLNPFFKPNLENITCFTEQMKHGLYRQFQIYQRFKPQSSAEDIQKKPFPFSMQNLNQTEKNQKKSNTPPASNKLSPDKIFKRASYHVGIAYSIYMDNIQKQGKQIKNFSQIDPTRFARQYKNSMKKY